MSPKLELELVDEAFVPGDAVRGTVRVRKGGRSRLLTAALEFHERSNMDGGRIPITVESGPLHEGELEGGMSFSFCLLLPEDALPEYTSRNGALYWEVHVRSDEPGLDTHVRQRVAVTLPHGDSGHRPHLDPPDR